MGVSHGITLTKNAINAPSAGKMLRRLTADDIPMAIDIWSYPPQYDFPSASPALRGFNFPITDRNRLGENVDIPHDEIHNPLICRIGEIRADF